MIQSLFTLGTAQLGMEYGLTNKAGKPELKKAFEVLDEAIKQGIRSFDTASAYGDSEKILGEYFYENKGLNNIEIITKLKPLILNSSTTEEIAIQEVEKSIEQSLERLKVNTIPILLFHRFDDLMWKNHFFFDYLIF